MATDFDDDSIFSMGGDNSDVFIPEPVSALIWRFIPPYPLPPLPTPVEFLFFPSLVLDHLFTPCFSPGPQILYSLFFLGPPCFLGLPCWDTLEVSEQKRKRPLESEPGYNNLNRLLPFTNIMQKAKAKAAPKKAAAKAAPKKLTQTTHTKKRKVDDDDLDDDTISGLSNTPPSAKKQKKAPAKKATGKKPLEVIENDSLLIDDDAEPAPTSKSQKKSATDTYQKLTQLEHIIKRPDTYIGSVELTEQKMWVYNKETSLMELRSINFVPGLYKIFDEILVNAADNKQRDNADHTMTYLKVNIDRSTGEISVENNGAGIPIEIHQVHPSPPHGAIVASQFTLAK
jgi:hypothetical protein